MGAMVTACNQAIQPAVKPASGPKTNRGNRAVPPDAGYAAPSSAWMSARIASMIAASTQDTSEAGPASVAAVSAPRSHPEPMIEPRETNRRPQNPTSRRRWAPAPLSAVLPVVLMTPPGTPGRRRPGGHRCGSAPPLGRHDARRQPCPRRSGVRLLLEHAADLLAQLRPVGVAVDGD